MGSSSNDWLVFDTNLVRYLLDVMVLGADPNWAPTADVDQQRRDAMRLFLHASTAVGPTQRAELARNPDAAQREAALRYVDLLFAELVPIEEQQTQIDARTTDLRAYHTDADDCRVLAEAEAFDDVRFLVTNDRTFRKRLNGRTRVELIPPSDLWVRLAIPPSAKAKWVPAPGHPLHGATWWRP